MSDLEHACRLLEVDEKFLQPFDVTDPFNDEVRLEGFLCLRPDHRYGALALLRVDGRSAPQRIFATPKLHYPFGKDGRFFFPAIQRADLYEKLDGTNVLAYRYEDADGRTRTTYKLRLSAVLRNSKWGPFLDYWRELLERHQALPHLIEVNGCHVSFEMYGARNAHLIAYEVPLAADPAPASASTCSAPRRACFGFSVVVPPTAVSVVVSSTAASPWFPWFGVLETLSATH